MKNTGKAVTFWHTQKFCFVLHTAPCPKVLKRARGGRGSLSWLHTLANCLSFLPTLLPLHISSPLLSQPNDRGVVGMGGHSYIWHSALPKHVISRINPAREGGEVGGRVGGDVGGSVGKTMKVGGGVGDARSWTWGRGRGMGGG